MVRDYKYRGHSAEETIRTWPKVRAVENKNIFPYNGEADVLFNSVLEYELPLLKKFAEPILRAVTPDKPEHGIAVRLLKALQVISVSEDESIVPNNSSMREFIGGSVFVDQDK